MLPTAIFANERGEWDELLTPSMPYSMSWEHTEREQTHHESEQTVEDQLIRVEQEILILKAELAYQNSEHNELNNYIHQLNFMGILPRFKERVARLNIFLTQNKNTLSDTGTMIESYLTVTGIQPLQFPRGGGGILP